MHGVNGLSGGDIRTHTLRVLGNALWLSGCRGAHEALRLVHTEARGTGNACSCAHCVPVRDRAHCVTQGCRVPAKDSSSLSHSCPKLTAAIPESQRFTSLLTPLPNSTGGGQGVLFVQGHAFPAPARSDTA